MIRAAFKVCPVFNASEKGDHSERFVHVNNEYLRQRRISLRLRTWNNARLRSSSFRLQFVSADRSAGRNEKGFRSSVVEQLPLASGSHIC
jgi:hypothetical protein